MRSEHFHMAMLPVRVPRGHDGFWQIICQLHEAQGTFTVTDIDGQSNVSVKSIEKYVRLLVAGGFIERVTDAKRFIAPVYRLVVKASGRAPRVRADGSLIHSGIDHLWTAMRSLRTFGLKDLIFAATTPELKPSYALARRYVGYLAAAGYLTPLQTGIGAGRPQKWRLKPGMDTGPKPPSRAAISEAMWDKNLRAFVGGAVATEVSP